MMTGSAGGSLDHAFADVVQDIEFVNGKGEVKTASRGTALWNAAGVSMGLLGVITHVTFRLGKTYLVQGVEVRRPYTFIINPLSLCLCLSVCLSVCLSLTPKTIKTIVTRGIVFLHLLSLFCR